MPPFTFHEFFAGGGMARAGRGSGWDCLFANDFDPRKAATYRANWGAGGEFAEGDVGAITLDDLPGRADLMWGSFPCQDLSVAGAGAGLDGERSGAFFPFWRLVEGLGAEGRAPRIVAIENVRGTLTARGGAGFATICAAFAEAGYRFGPMMIDAALFTPQSRPRLFIVGAAPGIAIADALTAPSPEAPFHPAVLVDAVAKLPSAVRAMSVWWRAARPPKRAMNLGQVLDAHVPPGAWHTPAQTDRLLSLMAPIHRAKVEALRGAGGVAVGAVYRRTRRRPDGDRQQRAEVRFDGLAGCLRTPAGGSSRQTLILIENGAVRSRLMSPRETARLMGLPDSYVLPAKANEAYHLTGDGVVVDVVRHLARTLFEPLLANCSPTATSDARARRVPSLQA
jgi:DNA (cytosine-5)-methyltransferase 1